jgi:hypothetical protein
MGDALRRLFLAIGVGLGIASGQPDPGLFARIDLAGGASDISGRDDRLVVSARVENAFAPGALELVEAGTTVALRFETEVMRPAGEPLTFEETRSLRYNLRSGLYDVAFDGGKKAALVDPRAARTLASELSALELCRASDAPEGTRIVVRAEIGIIDSRGGWHGAPVLWNYFGPRAVLERGRRPKSGE